MYSQKSISHFFLLHCFLFHNSLQDRQTTVILIATLQMRTVLLMSCLVGTWTSETFCFIFPLFSFHFWPNLNGQSGFSGDLISSGSHGGGPLGNRGCNYLVTFWSYAWLSKYKWTDRREFSFKFDCEQVLNCKTACYVTITVLFVNIQYLTGTLAN